MKKSLLVLVGSLGGLTAQAQLFSSGQLYIGAGAVVSANTTLINEGTLQSEGTLHLRGGMRNTGKASLEGKVVLDGTGNQSLESTDELKVGSLLLAQTGKVKVQAPLSVTNQLTFGQGILENTAQWPLGLEAGVEVKGASNRSHVQGYVEKRGNGAFEFPVGDGQTLHPFSMAKAEEQAAVVVGFVAQNPDRLSAKRSDEVEEITANSYWEVHTAQQHARQIAVLAHQGNDQLLQLQDNQWNVSASHLTDSKVATQVVLTGTTYFTIGTQKAESSEAPDVSVYPNPSNGSFDIQLKGFTANENISLDITDLSGRSLVKREGQVKDFSTKYTLGQEVANGSYFLRVLRTGKNQTFVQKLLIAK